MKRRRFKKAARKAWLLIQEQPSARLTWKEAHALKAYAKAHPNRVVKNWILIKEGGTPKSFYYQPPIEGPAVPPLPDQKTARVADLNIRVANEDAGEVMMTAEQYDAMVAATQQNEPQMNGNIINELLDGNTDE